MTNNAVLRRFRYALDIPDHTMLDIFRLGGREITPEQLTDYLRGETDAGYRNCSDKVFDQFLDGLIIHRRGPREPRPGTPRRPAESLTNNVILRKFRIALELREEDILLLLNLAGMDISQSELNALFRKVGHRHYRECGDQVLRNFLNGLTIQHRGDAPA